MQPLPLLPLATDMNILLLQTLNTSSSTSDAYLTGRRSTTGACSSAAEVSLRSAPAGSISSGPLLDWGATFELTPTFVSQPTGAAKPYELPENARV